MKNKNQNQEQEQNSDFEINPNPSKLNSSISFVLEIVKTVIISLAIILPIRYFIIQPFVVEGASMEPNFHNFDYLIIDEISYRFKEPQRGDIVVFKNPGNKKEYFIKRVIGLPNETVKIQDGKVYIKKINSQDFLELNENTYLAGDLKTMSVGEETILGSDEYFVLGDNRPNSRDSRYFGAIPESLITGRVFLRGFPFNRIKLFTKDNN